LRWRFKYEYHAQGGPGIAFHVILIVVAVCIIGGENGLSGILSFWERFGMWRRN